MPKPTLLQHILHKPSQSYTSPSAPPRSLERRNFHSLKDGMVKVATASSSSVDITPVRQPLPSPLPEPRLFTKTEDDDDDGSGGDEFYTPDTSPRTSVFSDHEHLSLASLPIVENILGPITHTDVITSPEMQIASSSSSPHSASHSHSRSVSRASSYSRASSSSTAVTPSVVLSDLTWDTRSTTSTRATSIAGSDPGHPEDEQDVNKKQGHQQGTSRRRKRAVRAPLSEEPDDWSKDVRWLVEGQNVRRSNSSTSSRSSRKGKSRTPRTPPEPAMLHVEQPAAIPERHTVGHLRSKSVGSRPISRRSIGNRRMSAVWEEDEGGEHGSSAQSRLGPFADPALHATRTRTRTQSAPLKNAHVRLERSASVGSRSTNVTASSSFTTSSRTVDIPLPLQVSDGGSPSGFTTLVLPRAAYTQTSKRYSALFRDASVDITRSGLSQTTMSTISITKNAAQSAFVSRPRFFSFSSFTVFTPGTETKVKMTASTPSHLLASLPPPLSVTSHTPPPSKIGSHQVLVQVFAVGLDSLDDHIVCEKVLRNDCYGFVPGRSFVGRAVECGFEVNNIAKSDWVMGLLDVRKCGGLSEFVVVEKRRLTRCPRPSPALTLEQLALLPLCGIPAHRAVRSSDHVQRGARALVLQGHDGAGAFAVQELVAYGVHVTVQIPPGQSSGKEENDEALKQVENCVRKWGAQEVVIDSPVAAVNSLHESEFDIVIDTVGGRRIWDACRRVLHTTGQFTTLVGDHSEAIPSVNAHFKSNLRSLRRAFVKKDHKSIGYEWISPITDIDTVGEDIRDSLFAVTKLALDGVAKPWIDFARCVPFERAPSLFANGEKATLGEGRTGVVRIVD